jgi:hypothetical protein
MRSLGFIRVRHRTFASRYPVKVGSASYDLVRAVRIDGKPRHKFVLSLGSLKDERPLRYKHSLTYFWIEAMARMKRHGLNEPERRQIADALVRKGVDLPSLEECQWHKMVHRWSAEPLDEIIGWLRPE